MLQKLRANNQKGFTLIELMIVVAIIGILAAIAIPNYLSYRAKSADNAAESELKNLYTATVAYAADAGRGADGTYGLAGSPPDFTRNTNVTLTGNITVAAGVISACNATAKHTSGNTTYSLDTKGKVQ